MSFSLGILGTEKSIGIYQYFSVEYVKLEKF